MQVRSLAFVLFLATLPVAGNAIQPDPSKAILLKRKPRAGAIARLRMSGTYRMDFSKLKVPKDKVTPEIKKLMSKPLEGTYEYSIEEKVLSVGANSYVVRTRETAMVAKTGDPIAKRIIEGIGKQQAKDKTVTLDFRQRTLKGDDNTLFDTSFPTKPVKPGDSWSEPAKGPGGTKATNFIKFVRWEKLNGKDMVVLAITCPGAKGMKSEGPVMTWVDPTTGEEVKGAGTVVFDEPQSGVIIRFTMNAAKAP